MSRRLTHLDEHGAARMVDVSQKDTTAREAVAEATITLSEDAFEAAISGDAKKGDVLGAARIAGIMAAKKTSELIPLCHPLPIAKAEIQFEPLTDRSGFRIVATVKTVSQTGVEMEALTAASVAALTIYDMLKAVDRGAVIENLRLFAKSGGKSGAYRAPAGHVPVKPAVPNKPKAVPRKSAPAALMNEVAAPRMDTTNAREAFRSFMVDRHLRATEWAKHAGVPVSQIYAFLTGRARSLSPETAEKLAKAARVKVDAMFAGKTKP